MLLQLLGGAHVVYFRNDDQLLLVRSDSSGRFSLSVVPISYVIGIRCSSLLFLVLSWIVFRCFQNPLLAVIWNVKFTLFSFNCMHYVEWRAVVILFWLYYDVSGWFFRQTARVSSRCMNKKVVLTYIINFIIHSF